LKLGRLRMKEIHELDVYKLSEDLSDLIWYGFDKWSVKAQNTIGYQIIRSSDSIAANLAEGYGRYTPADRKKFYLYARGSFEETKSWLRKLIRRKVIGESEISEYQRIIEELGPKLNAFIKSTI
jgi:four helix bundle protein